MTFIVHILLIQEELAGMSREVLSDIATKSVDFLCHNLRCGITESFGDLY